MMVGFALDKDLINLSDTAPYGSFFLLTLILYVWSQCIRPLLSTTETEYAWLIYFTPYTHYCTIWGWSDVSTLNTFGYKNHTMCTCEWGYVLGCAYVCLCLRTCLRACRWGGRVLVGKDWLQVMKIVGFSAKCSFVCHVMSYLIYFFIYQFIQLRLCHRDVIVMIRIRTYDFVLAKSYMCQCSR